MNPQIRISLFLVGAGLIVWYLQFGGCGLAAMGGAVSIPLVLIGSVMILVALLSGPGVWRPIKKWWKENWE